MKKVCFIFYFYFIFLRKELSSECQVGLENILGTGLLSCFLFYSYFNSAIQPRVLGGKEQGAEKLDTYPKKKMRKRHPSFRLPD